MRILLTTLLAVISSVFVSPSPAEAQKAVWPEPTYYRTVQVGDNKIFYREAGSRDNPTILFLHGFPGSSHMYRHLIPLLSGSFHIIAPDNLGSGYSDKPSPDQQPYSFDILADQLEGFVQALSLDKYTIYMQDFGAPVGFRLMLRQPDRLAGLITQNGNAYLDGLTTDRQDFFRLAHQDRSREMVNRLYEFTGEEAIRERQYLRDVRGKEEIMSPDSWTHDLHFLETMQQRKMQVQLLQDYYNNILAYPDWQNFLREHKPPTLILWGDKDPAFITAGGKAYLRDVPNAKLHLLDAGHFAMEEKPVEIVKLIMRFMKNRTEN